MSPLLWLLWVGCWEPKSTGPSGMVGRVVDSGGAPIAGVLVESLEAEVASDAAGRFAVQYKAPDQFVHFVVHDTWYQRSYLPTDQGREVALQLPPLVDRQVRCAPALQGAKVELRWEWSESWSARRAVTCPAADVGSAVILSGVPAGFPQVRSEGPVGEVVETEGMWVIQGR